MELQMAFSIILNLFSVMDPPSAIETCQKTEFRWGAACGKTTRNVNVREPLRQVRPQKSLPLASN